MTDRWLQKLKPAQNRQEYADAIFPGLRLRVGARSLAWSVLVRGPEGRKRIAIGKYPQVSLKEARQLAEVKSEGIKSEKAADTVNNSQRVGSLRDLFTFVIAKMREEDVASANEYENYLINRSDSALNVMGLDDDGNDIAANMITPDDVTRWLRGFHEAGAMTGHPRAYLSAAFGRGLSADYDPTNPNPEVRFNLTNNPVTHVGGKMKGKARDRALSMQELIDFWHGFEGRGVSPQMKLTLRLIMSMGGVRITEIVRSQKDWYQLRNGMRWISLPKTKNDHAHDLPLTVFADKVHQTALLISETGSPFLFPKHHEPDEAQTLNSISQAVRKWCDKKNVERFQPRDIRRTFKTLLTDRNPDLNRDWIDVWHNHGRAADVARKHYDRAEYLEVKRSVAEAIDNLMTDVERRTIPK
ncbi:integrase family protein [uncultured Roseibium sp.]|uniref:tyrosine-type recombinase/integrase n=1 Tax=uncultured Roseibium sp. TaxID=1936171 RepID=UPI002626B7EB|nr:integrase family protein [uncultured Roseibium sp.]